MRIGFMASHGGSGMKAVLQAIDNDLALEPVVFIGNNKNAAAFDIARSWRLPAYYLSANTHADPEQLDQAICAKLRAYNIDLLLLSGYMKKLGQHTLTAFKNRILNIHPSLLPKYGGQGMYGDRVHQAVLDNREHQTGASVHIVTDEYDQGPVLKQLTVTLNDTDTLESVREKVKSIEGLLYVQTLQGIVSGEIVLP